LKKILITGASGFIGNSLVGRLRDEGHEVITLGRNLNSSDIYFDILEDFKIPNNLFVDVVIHLAFCKNSSKSISELEVNTAVKLLKWCNSNGSLFVFLSSQSAHSKAYSYYGITKYEIEQVVLDQGGTVVTPPLVLGKNQSPLIRNMFSRLENSFLKPKFFPSPKLQICTLDSLLECLLATLHNNPNASIKVPVLDYMDYDLNTLIDKLLLVNKSNQKVTILIPLSFLNIVSSFFLMCKIRNKSLSDILTLQKTPLFNLEPKNTSEFAITDNLLIRKRKYRALLKEGIVLYKYLGIKQPSYSMLKKYISVFKNPHSTTIFDFPAIIVYLPWLLNFFDIGRLQKDKVLREKFLSVSALVSLFPMNKNLSFNEVQTKSELKVLLLLFFYSVSEVFFISVGFLLQFFIPNLSLHADKNDKP